MRTEIIAIPFAAAQAIATALQDAREKLNWENYKVLLAEDAQGLHVSFVAADTPSGQRGSVAGMPGITYILDKQGAEILAKYWIR